jgi:hypothetical protein
MDWLNAGSPPHYVWALLGLYSLLEWFLGWSKDVKANSLIGTIAGMLGAVLGKVPGVGPFLALVAAPAGSPPAPAALSASAEVKAKKDGGYVRVAFLPGLAAIALCVALACGPNTGTNVKQVSIDTAACALGSVPKDAAPLLQDLQNSLGGAPNAWGNAVGVAISAGVDVAACLFAALTHFVQVEHQGHAEAGMAQVVSDRLATFGSAVQALRGKAATTRTKESPPHDETK